MSESKVEEAEQVQPPLNLEEIEKGKLFKHDIDADEALKAVTGADGNIHIDEETNKRLLRKIDLNLMPVCVLRKHQPRTLR